MPAKSRSSKSPSSSSCSLATPKASVGGRSLLGIIRKHTIKRLKAGAGLADKKAIIDEVVVLTGQTRKSCWQGVNEEYKLRAEKKVRTGWVHMASLLKVEHSIPWDHVPSRDQAAPPEGGDSESDSDSSSSSSNSSSQSSSSEAPAPPPKKQRQRITKPWIISGWEEMVKDTLFNHALVRMAHYVDLAGRMVHAKRKLT